MRSPFLIPVVLLGVAAACLAVLAVASLRGETVAAERAVRDRLRAAASEGAGRLLAAAADLGRRAARNEEGTLRWREGRFTEPREPPALGSLAVVRGRDFRGEWFLEQAAAAELVDADVDRALGLYRSAADERNDERVRLAALWRLAAVLRQSGRLPEAREQTQAFLDLLPAAERATLREALLARALLAAEGDTGLRDDLLACVGGPDEEIGRGLLHQAGLFEEESLAARLADVARMKRLRPLAVAVDGAPEAYRIARGRLLARVRDPAGGFLLAEAPLPAPVAGTALVLPGEAAPLEADLVVESTAAAAGLLPGARVVATAPRREIEAAARNRALLTLSALGVLLFGAAVAIFLTIRAVRRESEAAAEKTRFVARIGHDLRTPLTLIRMYAETLAAGKVKDPAEAREFAGIAAREAKRLSALVDTVLDLSRLTALETAPRRTINLGALVAEVVATHRPLLEDAGMALEFDSPGNGLLVRGDEDALRGAVGNLLENAIRHAASGGAASVELTAAGAEAILRVADRGPGLPAVPVERLFERFFRAPGAAGKGAGLGLALVREVALLHGGRVGAADRAGGGAVFELALPLSID